MRAVNWNTYTAGQTIVETSLADGKSRKIAGNGNVGYVDGVNIHAEFNTISAIVAAGNNWLILDKGNNRIRLMRMGVEEIAPDLSYKKAVLPISSGEVTTVIRGDNTVKAGSGPDASIGRPLGMVILGDYAYVSAESGAPEQPLYSIVKVNLTTKAVQVLAGNNEPIWSENSCYSKYSSSGSQVAFCRLDKIATDGLYLYATTNSGQQHHLVRIALDTGATSLVSSSAFSLQTQANRKLFGIASGSVTSSYDLDSAEVRQYGLPRHNTEMWYDVNAADASGRYLGGLFLRSAFTVAERQQ